MIYIIAYYHVYFIYTKNIYNKILDIFAHVNISL